MLGEMDEFGDLDIFGPKSRTLFGILGLLMTFEVVEVDLGVLRDNGRIWEFGDFGCHGHRFGWCSLKWTSFLIFIRHY